MSVARHQFMDVGAEARKFLRMKRAEVGYRSSKRWLDAILAGALLPLSIPLVLVSWVLVKLTSRGPGFYTQERIGMGGKMFTIYKIRTMYQDSERNGARWCTPGDSRITPVGRLLRTTHLDETPQLWNVLKGDMSLVGPRPERPEIVDQLERALPNYRKRLEVPAGITGLAQVQQPPDTDLASVGRKLEYDLCYAARMSLSLDLRLMAGTVLKCLGVPFTSIRRILHLPNPNMTAYGETFQHDFEFSANAFAPETLVG